MALRAGEAPEPDARPWAIYARLSKAQDGGLDKVEHQVRLCRQHADERPPDGPRPRVPRRLALRMEKARAPSRLGCAHGGSRAGRGGGHPRVCG